MSPAAGANAPTVVLLHGLLRGPGCMKKLQKKIHQNTGFAAVSIGYPSRSLSIKDLAAQVAGEVHSVAGEGGEVWVVTHSLGGIVLRHIMDLPDQGGVIWKGVCMIAPPNRGSAVARRIGKAGFPVGRVYSLMYGKAGIELGCELEEGDAWPAPPKPCGVIAGTRSLALANPTSWVTSAFRLLSGESDGTVAVDETRLPAGMTDFVTVDAAHTNIMKDDRVVQLVITFLQHGSFMT